MEAPYLLTNLKSLVSNKHFSLFGPSVSNEAKTSFKIGLWFGVQKSSYELLTITLNVDRCLILNSSLVFKLSFCS
jgi:hypothetical protein